MNNGRYGVCVCLVTTIWCTIASLILPNKVISKWAVVINMRMSSAKNVLMRVRMVCVSVCVCVCALAACCY